MRIRSMAAVVIAILIIGSGKLNAQTADIQQTVNTKLAVTRLRCGVRIAESIRVLAETAWKDSVRNLQRTGTALHRFYDRLTKRSGDPMPGKEKP